MNREKDLERIMELYSDSIYRMSYFILQNDQDAQDILQETLIKYMQKAPDFQTESHERAWLLRVANNLCKDMLRFQKRNRHVDLDELAESYADTSEPVDAQVGTHELIMQIFALPHKYKRVIYLHYYEGYSVKEIASILKISENAVKKRLERGRNQLRLILEEDV